MNVVFTKHAIEKLRRNDVRNIFKIQKTEIKEVIKSPRSKGKTKYGEFYAVKKIRKSHDIRVIYDIIEEGIKVITFHIARKGRYK